jgi:hypothetical protein
MLNIFRRFFIREEFRGQVANKKKALILCLATKREISETKVTPAYHELKNNKP